MGYKTFVSMNIAIVSTGDAGDMYATAFAFAGHDVYMAWKDGEIPAPNPMLAEFDNVHVCSIEEAAEVADLVIIATAPRDVREVAYWLGDVRRKVIIDASGNIDVPYNEAVQTACAIGAITGSQHVVKVFNARGYEQILKPLFKGDAIELLMAGDSKKAKEITKILAVELGITATYDLGTSDTIPLFDELTKCWRSLAATQNVAAVQVA
ncbi:MAG: NAD(P)-binding domain-containing protein [Bacteroidota bacterium]